MTAADGTRPAGLAQLDDEMARQRADALASLSVDGALADRIAARIGATGRLLMLGMGASHWTSRIVLGLYRDCGIDAHAEPLSDQIRRPSPDGGRVTLIASQSGGSGEIAAYFRRLGRSDDHYGLTLNAGSELARSVPCLVAEGGREKPFAATRSIMVTLALHASILHRLSGDLGTFMAFLSADQGIGPAFGALPKRLARCGAVYLTGRGASHSVMEAAGLTLTELARVPTLAMEAGQLVHGPLEALDQSTALIVARGGGGDDEALSTLAARAAGFGAAVATIDNGDLPAVDGVDTIALPRGEGLGASAALLVAAQRLAIEIAAERVEGAGFPRRSQKVTDGEAA